MEISKFDPDEVRLEVQLFRERLRSTEERLRQQEQMLKEALFNLGRKEAELQRVTEERNKLEMKLALTDQKLKAELEVRAASTRLVTQTNRAAKYRSFLVSILFLVTSILTGFGTNFLTGSSPNSLGWGMLGLAVIIYVVTTFMTTMLAGGNNG